MPTSLSRQASRASNGNDNGTSCGPGAGGAVRTGDRFELTMTSGSRRWFDVRVDADRDETGQIIGIIGTSFDITEQKRREETLKTLLRELSHRSKNLLAIIQSLASQTARHSLTVPEFLVRFRGRIQSLSSSQDIVTDADWRGADLVKLIMMQVERYAPDGMQQIDFNAGRLSLADRLAACRARPARTGGQCGVLRVAFGAGRHGRHQHPLLRGRRTSGPGSHLAGEQRPAGSQSTTIRASAPRHWSGSFRTRSAARPSWNICRTAFATPS